MASKSVDGTLYTPANYGTATSPLASEAAKQSSNLDKDAFLKLLVAQMKYQDPLNPMDDKQFVAQMAQFTALEQMQNLNINYAKSQAYETIGREVSGLAFREASNSYEEVSGIVESVKMVNGEPVLVVNDGSGTTKDLELSRVEYVSEDIVRLRLLQTINQNLYNSENLALVGQHVQAITRDEKGAAVDYIEGVVDSIRFGSGQTVLMINGQELTPENIVSIGEPNNLIGTGREIEYYRNGQWNTGAIDDIKIKGDDIYAVINGEDIMFDKLDVLSNAFNMVGRKVGSMGENHTVTGVGLKNGDIYVFLGEGEERTEKLATEVKLVA